MPALHLGPIHLVLGKQSEPVKPPVVATAPDENPSDPTTVALEFLLRASARADQNKFIQVENIGYKSQIELLLNREALIDLYTVAFAVTEVRTVITRLREEVFRRGVEITPAFAKKCPVCGKEFDEDVDVCDVVDAKHSEVLLKLQAEYPREQFTGIPLVEPDNEQKEHLEAFLDNVNTFEQGFLDVMSELEDDLNIADDFFLHLVYEYIEGEMEDPETKAPIAIVRKSVV